MKMRGIPGRLILLAWIGLSTAVVMAKEPEQGVHAESIVAAAAAWGGAQFVRSDRAGNIFLFRGDKLEVYPVSRAGALGEPERLQATNEGPGLVLDAVLSPAGDQWLVHADGKVRLFVDGKEKPLPSLSWQPWSVGFLRGTPVVVVMPRPLPSAVLHLQDLGTVPWFLTLDNDRWHTMLEHSGLSAEAAWKERYKWNEWVAKYALSVAPARDGKLWVANQYSYRVQRLSPSGKNLLEIDVGNDKKRAPRNPPENAAANAVVRQLEAQGEKAQFRPFTEEAVIADLVEGSGHAIYLLVHTSGADSLALDRYDTDRGVLERIPLALKGSGRLTMAAGKDGLYVAPFRATGGLWRISWATLESAPWKKVEEVKIDGGTN
jgi:hypothetical protein